MSSTAIPRVANTWACSRATWRSGTGAPREEAAAPSAPAASTTATERAAATAAIQYAHGRPPRAMSAAPANGPMNWPMRCTPPSVDSTRARFSGGVTSVR